MENFPNLVKEIDVQPQEAQRVPRRMNSKRPTPRHIILKMPKSKCKERTLKAAREKQLVTYKGAPIRLAADFSKETMQDRRAWHKILKVVKTQDLQPRLLYPSKRSFRVRGQGKSFPDPLPQKRKKLKEFINTKPEL